MATALDTNTWVFLKQPEYKIEALAAFQRFRGLSLPWDDLIELQDATEFVAKASRSRKVVKLSAGQFGTPVDLFVKRYNLRTFLRLLLRTGRKTRAREEFDLGWKLIHLGIKTPRPVWLAEATGTLSRYSLLATEALSGADSVLTRWDDCADEAERFQLLETIGQFTRQLHEAGFYHDDYKANHLMLFPTQPVAPKSLYVIDLLGGRFTRLNKLFRSKNLYQMLRSFLPKHRKLNFTREHRHIFLRAYAGSEHETPTWSKWVDRVGHLKGRALVADASPAADA